MLALIVVLAATDVQGSGDFLTKAMAAASISALAGMGLMQGSIGGLRGRLKDAQGEIEDLKTKRKEDQATIAELKGDLNALAKVVTHEVQWEILTSSLDDHHRESMQHWRRMETLVEDNQKIVRKLLEKYQED